MLKRTSILESNAEAVIIGTDNPNDLDDVLLRISTDCYVHYDSKNKVAEYSTQKNGFRLMFDNYRGEILLPKHTTIEIYSEGDVSGTLSVPALISGSGNVDLKIDKDSGLEISVYMNAGRFELNDTTLECLKGAHGLMYGPDVYRLSDMLETHQKNVIKNKATIYSDVREEYPNEVSVNHIDVCRCYNILYLEKYGGLTKIEYKNAMINKSHNTAILLDQIRYLGRILKKSLIAEDYETAQRVHKYILGIDTHVTKQRLEAMYTESKDMKLNY